MDIRIKNLGWMNHFLKFNIFRWLVRDFILVKKISLSISVIKSIYFLYSDGLITKKFWAWFPVQTSFPFSWKKNQYDVASSQSAHWMSWTDISAQFFSKGKAVNRFLGLNSLIDKSLNF